MKKTLKHSLASLIALAMLVVMAIPAFAQDVTLNPANANNATITVKNAAKGATYKVFKLFDATYNSTTETIAYTGTIPSDLETVFKAENNGIAIQDGMAEADGKTLTTAAATKVADWAKKQADTDAILSATANGSVLNFKGLPYGYYVVTTSLDAAVVAADSTNPNATVYDKVTVYPGGLTKNATDDDLNIGQDAEFTVTYQTTNFEGTGSAAKRITSYTITDTLPAGLTLKEVTEIKIGADEYKVKDAVPQFDNGKITIPWVNADNESLYDNGTVITIKYLATVNDNAVIGNAGNTNKVALSWMVEDDTTPHDEIPDPDDPTKKTKVETEETVYTYAFALQKVNEKGTALEGAEFKLPFFVKSAVAADGAYIYAGTTAGEGLTDTVRTPENGLIVVKGVEYGTNGKYQIEETKAPDGYNKINGKIEVEVNKDTTTASKTTVYFDEDGNITNEVTETTKDYASANVAAKVNVIENKAGSILPSTGGIGTYVVVIAGLAIVAAGVIIARKRKMED